MLDQEIRCWNGLWKNLYILLKDLYMNASVCWCSYFPLIFFPCFSPFSVGISFTYEAFFLIKFHFSQRFLQHFELLQKACIPDGVSYVSFKETINHARLSVSILMALVFWWIPFRIMFCESWLVSFLGRHRLRTIVSRMLKELQRNWGPVIQMIQKNWMNSAW